MLRSNGDMNERGRAAEIIAWCIEQAFLSLLGELLLFRGCLIICRVSSFNDSGTINCTLLNHTS